MKNVHIHRGLIGCCAFLFLLFANAAVADEGKHGKHHSMDKEYGEYYDGASHGVKGHHGEIRVHGKGHGHGKKHGQSKKREHHSMHGDAHHHAFSLHTLKKKLHLTDAQVNTLRPIEADYKKAVIRKKADVRIAEIDLGLLIDSQSPDRGQLQKIVDSIGRMKGELMMARIDAFLNVRKELTAEQQEQFSKMVHGHMMGHGHVGSGHGKGHHGMKGHHGSGAHGKGYGKKSKHDSSGHGMGHEKFH